MACCKSSVDCFSARLASMGVALARAHSSETGVPSARARGCTSNRRSDRMMATRRFMEIFLSFLIFALLWLMGVL